MAEKDKEQSSEPISFSSFSDVAPGPVSADAAKGKPVSNDSIAGQRVREGGQSIGGLATKGDGSSIGELSTHASAGASPASEGAGSATEAPGQMLDGGRLTLIEKIGEGGMGVVWKAKDNRLGRFAAVKRPKGALLHSAKGRARFLREAQACARLSHPNVVTVYNVGEDAAGPFIEMEFVEGCSLREEVRRARRAVKDDAGRKIGGNAPAGMPALPVAALPVAALPVPERVYEIGAQLCDALALAHQYGIIHRDIKPGNIFITPTGIPKLGDFGLAAARAEEEENGEDRLSMTSTGAMLGTMYYASPEQLLDAKSVGPGSDIYSLAATLYFALTGEDPRMLDLELVPEALRPALRKALQKLPEQRYADMKEFGAALKQAREAATAGECACPQCHKANAPSAKHCAHCGANLAALFAPCPKCKTENRRDQPFCVGCGTDLKAAAEAERERQRQEEEQRHAQLKKAIEDARERLAAIPADHHDERIMVLERLAELMPGDGETKTALETARTAKRNQEIRHLQETAKKHFERREFDEALKALQEALALAPAAEALQRAVKRVAEARDEAIKQRENLIATLKALMARGDYASLIQTAAQSPYGSDPRAQELANEAEIKRASVAKLVARIPPLREQRAYREMNGIMKELEQLHATLPEKAALDQECGSALETAARCEHEAGEKESSGYYSEAMDLCREGLAACSDCEPLKEILESANTKVQWSAQTHAEGQRKRTRRIVKWALIAVTAIAVPWLIYEGVSRMGDHADWDRAVSANTPISYEAYLSTHPFGGWSREARTALEKLHKQSWETARTSGASSAYKKYLEAYPSGAHAKEAQDALVAALEKERQAWAEASKLYTVESVKGFLVKYPCSAFETEAQTALSEAIKKEDTAWQEANQKNTKIAYNYYLDNYPAGIHTHLAKTSLQDIINLENKAMISSDTVNASDSIKNNVNAVKQVPDKKVSKAKDLEKEETYVETLNNLKMIWVRKGAFVMGSNDTAEEKPMHTVDLDGFWMGETEITQAQYESIIGTNPSEFKNPNNPVERVYHSDALNYCKVLSRKADKNYTLPTEAQWEYACRAGTLTRYFWGDSPSPKASYLWDYANSNNSPHPVKQKRPNAWGFYDMYGNVWEWCLDRYGNYNNDRQKNPTGATSGYACVIRGGSWNDWPNKCRSSFRLTNGDGNRGFGGLGFRIVRIKSTD
ncbi:MAG: SUMF1/EgtB/PvdO family nonheme iron enzyme [Candidatus Sumerlaeota bacterium]|nr:SUMF1/EgtB/PvdO family nonheme iron enzyme [Candidatus Sumerlaeota bacterium]